MIFGAKEEKLIKLLNTKAERSGNELTLAWLNTPGLFQTDKERKVREETNDEKLKRLSLRKFTYGMWANHFKSSDAALKQRQNQQKKI